MKNIFTVFTALVCMGAYAQNPKLLARDSTLIRNCKKEIIKLPANAVDTSATALPISGFIIRDVRFDTAFIGARLKNIPHSKNKAFLKLGLHTGATKALSNYFNASPGIQLTSHLSSLTCFVKSLWIKQADSLDLSTNNLELFTHISFQVEAYLGKGDRYYPALRFDTVAISKAGEENKFSALEDVLQAFVAKAARMDTAKIYSRNAYTLSELDNQYTQRFNQPILTDQLLNAGVYMSFHEFVTNNPSVKEFELKTDRKATFLYTRTGTNNWLPERNAFGFCDGKVIWKQVQNSYQPLVRQGNTFEFLVDFYPFYQKNKTPNYVDLGNPLMTFGASLLSTGASELLTTSPFGKILYQLNMENGNF